MTRWRRWAARAGGDGDERSDRALWLAAGGLSLISLVGLRSASMAVDPSLLGKQAAWAAAGAIASVAIARVRYSRWIDVGVLLMPVAVGLLLLVLLAGTEKLGAARWLTVFGISLQPSEFVKLTTACCLARFLGGRRMPVSLADAALAALIAGLPAVLVFMQPDLGSSSVVAAMWCGAVVAAGLSGRALLVGAGSLLAASPVVWHLLKDYQRQRLLTFIDPYRDPLGAGYTIIQSIIAIGSGRWLGKGWMAGTQNQLQFLPERHSDFLFAVIGEEWGFLGAVATVALFGLLLWRMLAAALGTSDAQGRLLAVAAASWLGYQAVVNMGMVMGLLPVVGVPLPFIGYGGSSMVSVWVAVGLVQSVRRFSTRF